jgi:hypothetical protein
VALQGVTVGEVWLVRWDAISEFGIVMESSDLSPRLAPVSFDGVRNADERFVMDVHGFGSAVVLPHLSRILPAVTLDAVFARAPLPHGALPERITESDIEEQVEQSFDKAASWRPGIGGVDIRAMLWDLGAPVKDLAVSLGMASAETLRLLRGTLLPTWEQAVSIGSVLRVPAETVIAGTRAVPEALRDAISVRSFRGSIDALSARHGWSNSEAWLHVAQGVLTPQYRQRLAAQDIDWAARADHWVEANLD